MKIFEHLEEWLVWGSRLGTLGEKMWGRLIAPLVAIPFVFMGRFFYGISCDLFYIALILMLLQFIVATHLALSDLPLERHKEIMLPRLTGMMLAFFYVPVTPDKIFWGFIIFTGLMYIIPRLLRSQREKDVPLGLFSGVTGLFIDEVAAGIISCLVLQITWAF